MSPKVLVRGHWDLELWGLAVHPIKPIFYTVGEDKLLAMWDTKTKEMKKCVKNVGQASKAVACSPNGNYVAIGCKNGDVVVYDANKLTETCKLKKTKKEISVIKFSPDAKILAAGTAPPAAEVLLFNTEQNFTIQAMIKNQVIAIKNLKKKNIVLC